MSAGYSDGSAAAVGTDGSGGVAFCGYVQVFSVHGSAAGGHKSPGAVALCVDGGIRDIHACALSITEYTVGVFSVCGNICVAYGKLGSVFGQNGGIFTVEVRLIPFRITAFYYGNVVIGSRFSICMKSVAAIFCVFIADIFRGVTLAGGFGSVDGGCFLGLGGMTAAGGQHQTSGCRQGQQVGIQ